jgi:probable HAF family extracellular repeat protein
MDRQRARTLFGCTRWLGSGSLALGLASFAAAASAVPVFHSVGDLPGGTHVSTATDVSADGRVVVGGSDSAAGFQAYYWTEGAGMVGLGAEASGDIHSTQSSGASSDGSVVVGTGLHTDVLTPGFEAFRWTQAGGLVGLGDLPGGRLRSTALDVSADGSVVVGSSDSGFVGMSEAFIWTAAAGMVGLGDLPGGAVRLSTAHAVSADGLVVVGSGHSASGTEAFRWTAAGGMIGLGDLAGGGFESIAYDVSADKAVIVGSALSVSGVEAFIWTQAGGMVGLGDLPGGGFGSTAWAVSADGSVVVGHATTAAGQEAFIWTAGEGMRLLKDVIEDVYGIDLGDWRLESALGISADGLTIAGRGISPGTNADMGWRFSVVPEPGTALLLLSGILGLAARRTGKPGRG